ncbi:MAG TPA: hypothetical protein VM531_11360 [Sphingomicrobium sp.]|jgi:hypothetical protein|nr:hypothetical protein [Sphingomicrobium sp.]
MNILESVTRQVAASSDLQTKLREDPVGTLQTISATTAPPLQTDVWIYRVLVGGLCLVVLCAMIGAIALSFYGKGIPETLTALGSGALGAVGALLVPSPARQ